MTQSFLSGDVVVSIRIKKSLHLSSKSLQIFFVIIWVCCRFPLFSVLEPLLFGVEVITENLHLLFLFIRVLAYFRIHLQVFQVFLVIIDLVQSLFKVIQKLVLLCVFFVVFSVWLQILIHLINRVAVILVLVLNDVVAECFQLVEFIHSVDVFQKGRLLHRQTTQNAGQREGLTNILC